jgi:L-fuculose-phosphate aldolase
MNETQLREAIIDAACQLNTRGLCVGNSGNVSARCDDMMLITPTGIAYHELRPADVVKLNLAGEIIEGHFKPSSEWHFHCAILAERPEVNAIVHTHSLHCTALASTERGIPAFHYMVAVAGGPDIRCAPYATYGTQALAEHAVAALKARRACLLAHHGSIAVGDSTAEALALAIQLEDLAAQYCEVLKIGGEQLLTDEQMTEVLTRFASYGQQD